MEWSLRNASSDTYDEYIDRGNIVISKYIWMYFQWLATLIQMLGFVHIDLFHAVGSSLFSAG